MKRIFSIFLFLPMFADAQWYNGDSAFSIGTHKNLGRPIHLPPRDYNPDFRPTETFSYSQKERVYIIREDSDYQKLFYMYIYTKDSLTKAKKQKANRYHIHWITTHMKDSVPVIDFSRYELVVYAACAQCLFVCHHKTADNSEPCHRNACSFMESFFLRVRESGMGS
ncbi:MAG: hypothetical protein V9F01_04595 [Chitinophagaceae bacterium]